VRCAFLSPAPRSAVRQMAQREPMCVLYAPTFGLSTPFCKIIKIFLCLADPVADLVKTATRAKKIETKNV
jgi:hypothetical protein